MHIYSKVRTPERDPSLWPLRGLSLVVVNYLIMGSWAREPTLSRPHQRSTKWPQGSSKLGVNGYPYWTDNRMRSNRKKGRWRQKRWERSRRTVVKGLFDELQSRSLRRRPPGFEFISRLCPKTIQYGTSGTGHRRVPTFKSRRDFSSNVLLLWVWIDPFLSLYLFFQNEGRRNKLEKNME